MGSLVVMAEAGPVTNGLSAPAIWWGQLITGRCSLCICMARGTLDLPSEAGSPKLWERFFFSKLERLEVCVGGGGGGVV